MIEYELSNLFMTNCKKDLILTFSNGDVYTNEDIYSESMKITESLCSQENLAFGCCEASSFTISVVNRGQRVYKGLTVEVDLILDDNTENPFRIGTYKVDSNTLSDDKTKREIVAYSLLSEIINGNYASWYNGLTFPMTLKNFRDSFFNYVGLDQEETTLQFDDMQIEKTIDADEINGASIIGSICEINARWGTINRNNVFVYRDLSNADDINYSVTDYKELRFEDFTTALIDKVQIRQEENDIGAIAGTGTNALIIQDNFLVYGKSAEDLQTIASWMLSKVGNERYTYIPNSLVVKCNMCLEVGDRYSVTTTSGTVRHGLVLQREINGIQNLIDNISAKGTKLRTEQVNSLNSEIIKLKGKYNKIVKTIDGIEVEIGDVAEELRTSINVNTQSITAEVSRATAKEEELKGSIELTDSKFSVEIASIQKQLDGEIIVYDVDEVPTLTNYPAMDFTTALLVWPETDERCQYLPLEGGIALTCSEEDYQNNLRATAYYEENGMTYKFRKVDGVWGWVEVSDTDFGIAMQRISELEMTTEEISTRVYALDEELGTDYYTKTETESKITQTSDSLTSEINSVKETYATKTEVTSEISQSTTAINARINSVETDLSNNYSNTTEMNRQISLSKDGIMSEVSDSYYSKTDADSRYLEASYSSVITQNTNSITSEVSRATKAEGSLSSRITQNASQIALKVDGSDYTAQVIVDKINNGSVTISASKVNLNGYVTATSLEEEGATVINGSNITTGKLNSLELNACDGSMTSLYMTDKSNPQWTGYINGIQRDGTEFNFITFINTSQFMVMRQSARFATKMWAHLGEGIQFGHPIDNATHSGAYYRINTMEDEQTLGRNTLYARHHFLDQNYNELKSVIEIWYNKSTGASGINENTSSSRRYKENIEPLADKFAKNLLKMDVVTFDYINGEKGYHGMIAEDVAEIDDYGIVYDEQGRPDAIDYRRYIPDLIKLCQLQQKEIDELKSLLKAKGDK